MQSVDQNQPGKDDELEPVLYAALIDSMLQNFWPMLVGSLSTAIATVMTALKTGNMLLWPFVVLIIGIGTARAFQVNELAGAFASLALGLNAIATALLVPLLLHLF